MSNGYLTLPFRWSNCPPFRFTTLCRSIFGLSLLNLLKKRLPAFGPWLSSNGHILLLSNGYLALPCSVGKLSTLSIYYPLPLYPFFATLLLELSSINLRMEENVACPLSVATSMESPGMKAQGRIGVDENITWYVLLSDFCPRFHDASRSIVPVC